MSDEYEPIEAVAQRLGVSSRYLRAWVAGRDVRGGAIPSLPSRQRGRAHLVRASEAYEHIRRHASRVPEGLRAPDASGGVQVPRATPVLPACSDDPGETIHAILDRLARMSPEQVPASWITALSTAARELRQAEELKAAQSEMIPRKDAEALLAPVAEAFAVAIEHGVRQAAERIVERLRAICVELDANCAVVPHVEAVLRQEAQAWADAVRAKGGTAGAS